MKCKFCQAEWDEEGTVCPVCGKDNAEEEQIEKECCETAETAEEEVATEEVSKPAKARISSGKLAVIYIAVLAVVAVLVFFVFFGMKGNEPGAPSANPDVTEGTVPEDGNQDDVTCQGSYTVSNSMAKSKAGKVVATAADGTETVLSGFVYSNSGSTSRVWVGIKLYEGDILTAYTSSNGGYATVTVETPSGKLIEVEQADGVAHLEEMAVGGVVATHGIHVHLLDELGILEAHGGTQGTPCLGMEAVAIGALDNEFGAVEVDAVVGAHLDGAEADAVAHAMSPVAQGEGGGVEVWVLGVPGLGVGVYPATLLLIIRYGSAVDGEGDGGIRCALHLRIDLAIGTGIDAHV